MQVRQLFDAASSTYTYLLWDEESRQAALVDTVYERHARDAALVRELGLDLRYVLDTHVHADHVTGAWLMQQALGARTVLSAHGGAEGVDRPVDDGDEVAFGKARLRVMATPGHTHSCVTYVAGDQSMAFTGDCLLIRGAGRTDFQQGDAAQLFHSIRRIFSLPDDCLLYPGHDYQGRTVTTVAEERAHNPRVGGQANEQDFVGYMENLKLAHPKKIEVALPANLRSGRPENGRLPQTAAWGPVVETYAGILEIDADWVHDHRDRVHLLDVREPHEAAEELGAIAGALAIPLGQLDDRKDELPKDRPLVVFCRSGRRSAQATVLLKKAGEVEVANLKGGLLRWRELGFQS